MELFSLDSVILIIVTCNCFPFSWFEVDFSETHPMTSAGVGVSKVENVLREDTPDPLTGLLPSALAVRHPPPPPLRLQKPSYGPAKTSFSNGTPTSYHLLHCTSTSCVMWQICILVRQVYVSLWAGASSWKNRTKNWAPEPPASAAKTVSLLTR